MRNVPAFLVRLITGVCSSAHLEHWCMMLREMAGRREMLKLRNSGTKNGDLFDEAKEIEETLKRILDIKSSDTWQHIAEVAVRAERRMSEKTPDATPGITTTYAQLDRTNGGFRPGNLIVIAARPSVGKTAFAGGLATEQAKQGYRPGFITLEMNSEDIFDRILSAQSDVMHYKIDRNIMNNEHDRNRVYETIMNLAKLPIYFSDKTNINLHDIRGKAERLIKKHGCDILYIDYLQLVEPESAKGKTREQEVAQISRGLKQLAMTLQIPIVLLAQLNREYEKDKTGDKKPKLHHLRESGSIEQDADGVLMLYRDWKSDIKTNPTTGESTEHEADLLIRKWRNGTTFEMKIGFEPEMMRFHDLPDQNFVPAKIPTRTIRIDRIKEPPVMKKGVGEGSDNSGLPF